MNGVCTVAAPMREQSQDRREGPGKNKPASESRINSTNITQEIALTVVLPTVFSTCPTLDGTTTNKQEVGTLYRAYCLL